MDADSLLQLAQTLVAALSAVPNPIVVAVAAAVGAGLMVYRKYRATKSVDPQEVADAAKKAQEAAKAIEAALPKAEPKFDQNVFGAMTESEKAAAKAKK